MGKALEVVSGFVTAPGATLTGWTVPSGNSLTIRNTSLTSRVRLLAAWAQNQVAGVLRLRSPRLHDFVQGIRMRVGTADQAELYPIGFQQFLIPQDTLTVEQSGSAVAGQIESGSFLVWYDDLVGIAGRFTDPDTVRTKGVNLMAQEVALTPGVGGGYTGAKAVNATFDNWKANTDYALVGAIVDAAVATIRVQGVDIGNLGVGIPGLVQGVKLSAEWFLWLASWHQIACVPVFNAANKFSITVDALQSQAGAAVNVVLHFVELPPGTIPGAVSPLPVAA